MTIEELIQEIGQVRKLILIRQESLQMLREREAKHGLDVPISLKHEIKETEEALEQLRNKLQKLQREKEYLEAPVVYIANFGPLPADLPADTVKVKRSEEFVVEPRLVPAAERWQSELWPELMELRQRVKRSSGLIRLQGSSTLTSAFAFGQVFRNVGGYYLAVEQRTKNDIIVWDSREEPPYSERASSFSRYQSELNPKQQDVLIIVYAAPHTTLAAMVGEVGRFWGEAENCRDIVADVSTGYIPQQAKGILIFEAKTVSQGEQLKDWQAATLASSSRRMLMEFLDQMQPARVHLFMAGPAGLAAFLGHHWNQVGWPIQFYERIEKNRYTPSLEFNKGS